MTEKRDVTALTLPKLLDALEQQRCNGCHAPRKTWGPICGGMTQGDYTHYHSPEWWWGRFHRENPWEADVA